MHLESNYTHQCGPTDSCYQEMAEVERNNVDGYVFGYEKYQNLTKQPVPSLRRALPAADSCDTVLDFVFTLIIINIIVVLVYCRYGSKAECGPVTTGMTPYTYTGNSLLTGPH